MNHSTVEGVVHFLRPQDGHSMNRFQKASSNEPFPDTIVFKASLVQNASLRHHYTAGL